MYRQRRRNSTTHYAERDKRNSGSKSNKRHALVREMGEDFHPDEPEAFFGWDPMKQFRPSISMTSDSDLFFDEEQNQQIHETGQVMFGGTATLPERDERIHWNPEGGPLRVTSLEVRFDKPWEMEYQCRRAHPVIDKSIHDDLQSALPTSFRPHFFATILPMLKGRFSQSRKHPELIEQAKEDLRRLGLTRIQVDYIQQVCENILCRSSYGILFVKKGQFASYRVNNGAKQRTTVKGYSELNANGQWESPWDTAVRVGKSKLVYSSTEPCDWHELDLNALGVDYKQISYLECLVAGFSPSIVDRYIGLFIIRLNENMEIQPGCPFDILEWHPISGEYRQEFYTLAPFIKYLKQNPTLVQ